MSINYGRLALMDAEFVVTLLRDYAETGNTTSLDRACGWAGVVVSSIDAEMRSAGTKPSHIFVNGERKR